MYAWAKNKALQMQKNPNFFCTLIYFYYFRVKIKEMCMHCRAVPNELVLRLFLASDIHFNITPRAATIILWSLGLREGGGGRSSFSIAVFLDDFSFMVTLKIILHIHNINHAIDHSRNIPQ